MPGFLWWAPPLTLDTLENPRHGLFAMTDISNLHSLQEKSQREALSSTGDHKTARRMQMITSTFMRESNRNIITNAGLETEGEPPLRTHVGEDFSTETTIQNCTVNIWFALFQEK